MQKIDGIEYLTLKEACEYLGKSDSTIRRWVKKGLLKGKRVGLMYYFKKSDLKSVFEEG